MYLLVFLQQNPFPFSISRDIEQIAIYTYVLSQAEDVRPENTMKCVNIRVKAVLTHFKKIFYF